MFRKGRPLGRKLGRGLEKLFCLSHLTQANQIFEASYWCEGQHLMHIKVFTLAKASREQAEAIGAVLCPSSKKEM